MAELPKPPWYRRFGAIFLAANLLVAAVLVAAVVALWPPAAAQRPGAPATTAGAGPQAGQLLPDGPSQRRSCRPRPGLAWSRGCCGNGGGAPGRWVGGSRRPAAGGLSGHSTARALPSTAGATSSCLGPVTSRRSRCSALGSGDGASCRSPVAAEAASPSSRCVTGGWSKQSHPRTCCLQVGIAALDLDRSGVPPARTCMPHLDKVAGKPDVAQTRVRLATEAPGTSKLRLFNISERTCGGARSPVAQLLAGFWQGPCW